MEEKENVSILPEEKAAKRLFPLDTISGFPVRPDFTG